MYVVKRKIMCVCSRAISDFWKDTRSLYIWYLGENFLMKYWMGISLCFLLFRLTTVAQKADDFNVWDPASADTAILEGQAWPQEVKDGYDRFPARAQMMVEKDVWDLSKNSAGLLIKFKSNATTIKVSYQVNGKLAFPHMPATGVSGLDPLWHRP